jgi:hypothetical protein
MKHRLSIGMLLTTFGLVYQVIGAWPLWDQPYYWGWQAEIAEQGNLLVWLLFAASLAALVIGIALLYLDSKEYHERHPELYETKRKAKTEPPSSTAHSPVQPQMSTALAASTHMHAPLMFFSAG